MREYQNTPTTSGAAIPPASCSYVWNCTGGVRTSLTDENSQIWSTAYTDPNYWRPSSTTDPTSAVTSLCYWPDGPSGCPSHSGLFGSESTLNFNGTTSTVDTLTARDGLGRMHVSQRLRTQGGTSYDSVETDYDHEGRAAKVSVPYTGTAGQAAGATFTVTSYDALGRPLTVTDGGGGATTYSYTQTPGTTQVGYDVLVTVSGGQSFKKQLEYDGLGRLTSVCEITSASGIGAGTCAQSVSQTGFWTKYTYDVLNDILTVKQNAQSSISYQTRTYVYDGLGRMTSEQNPETNGSASSYTFDTDGTCGTHNGDLVKRIDPQGTVTCYGYDALHRLTTVSYTGGYSGVTPSKTYVYDLATVNGSAMQYVKGRLAEAYTGSIKTTDLGFSYTKRGEVSDVYQLSPHSGTNYYYHVSATYLAPQGLLNTLNPNMGGNIPTWTYGPDGEGRVNTVSASSGANPVTGTSYNGFSEPTGVTLGSGDSDAFAYDSTTGRMTQYKATINSSAAYGNLTWNANWTLKSLATTDPFNLGNNGKTCNYAYDDLVRLSQVDCGSGNWGQNFSYVDNGTNSIAAFGNLSKTVIAGHTGQSFSATYSDTTNRISTLSYDNNGNLLGDGSQTYTWDGEGNLATLGGNAETYDALDRRVEQSNSGVYTEIVYGPDGSKLALMSGQSVNKVFTPLPGGATAVYTSAGLQYYRHPDWLGSSRLASTPTHTIYQDTAYAPFGEAYVESTSNYDRYFTGQNQDLTPGLTGDLYDFLYREQHTIQGRWISPDPAGISAVDPTNPQSWNRYSYTSNSPLNSTDPLGLDATQYKFANGCIYSSMGTSGFTMQIRDGQITWTQSVVWGPWQLVWCASTSGSSGTAPWPGAPQTGGAIITAGPSTGVGGGGIGSNNGPSWYQDPCVTGALSAGALSVGVDAIGLIPEAGGISRIIGHAGGYRGIVADQAGFRMVNAFGKSTSTAQGLNGLLETSPTGLVSTGLTVAGFIPGAGQVFAGLSIGFDIFKTARVIAACH